LELHDPAVQEALVAMAAMAAKKEK